MKRLFLVVLIGCSGAASASDYSSKFWQDLLKKAMSTVAQYSVDTSDFLKTDTEENAVAKAKEAVADQLKDPNSAQFRKIRIAAYKDGKVVCGEVNAKNSYGGYTGFVTFVASPTAATIYDPDASSPEVQTVVNSGIAAACTIVPDR